MSVVACSYPTSKRYPSRPPALLRVIRGTLAVLFLETFIVQFLETCTAEALLTRHVSCAVFRDFHCSVFRDLHCRGPAVLLGRQVSPVVPPGLALRSGVPGGGGTGEGAANDSAVRSDNCRWCRPRAPAGDAQSPPPPRHVCHRVSPDARVVMSPDGRVVMLTVLTLLTRRGPEHSHGNALRSFSQA